MGFNTVLQLSNDFLNQIAENPDLGQELLKGVSKSHVGKRAEVCQGLKIIDQFHSSEHHLFVAGGNTAWAIWRDVKKAKSVLQNDQVLKDELELLAKTLGYTLVPIPQKKKPDKEAPPPKFL